MALRSAFFCVILFALASCGGDLSENYRDQASYLQDTGRLRVDRDPADAPVSNATLAQNFMTIALAVEDFGQQRARKVPLRRWEEPIRYRIFGNQLRGEDRAAITAFFRRLSGLTNLRISATREKGNFAIFVLDAEERRTIVRESASDERGVGKFLNRFLGNTTPNSPCHASILTNDAGQITFAAVLIKSETQGRLRQACIEEELAQSMGLTNDDPDVRPSIFNDDQEFAFLTRHDEYLLEILYNPALRIGWTEREIAPKLPGIIKRLRPRDVVVPTRKPAQSRGRV